MKKNSTVFRRPGNLYFILRTGTMILWGFTMTLWNPLKAQNASLSLPQKKLNLFQDTLKKLGIRIIQGADEMDRKAATYKFIPVLVRALKTPGSFEFPFDSIKTFRVVYSPDRKFRIFTWFVNINESGYRFYGVIQMKGESPVKLYPLIDFTDHISKPEDTITSPKKWIGAEYYSILPPDDKGNYVLLGWKGVSNLVSGRLIEVLHFENDQAVFGAPIFNYFKKDQKRILFFYTKQATMMLKYIEDKKWIIFDHLEPSDTMMRGKFEYYGPDLTYDGLTFSEKKWNLMQNLNLSNLGSKQDSLFINPKKRP